ncbi:MAG: (d)CMP kinase [Propionibacteriaceae bacterium]|nr:(d)CMP kinase [Propionibacteriaceae bacterium]
MRELVIAMDGPSGVGKSSTARRVAQLLRLGYLDTGAMYRAVAVEYRRLGLKPEDTEAIGRLAAGLKLRISTDPLAPRIFVNGRDVTDEIRDPAISAVVSQVATVPEVRRVLTLRMRQIIAEHNRRIVVEGRDITTIVAPDADVRLLLTAEPAVRVGRRATELGQASAQVTDSIVRRDREDSSVANFTEAAEGVTVIDSTHLNLDQVVAAVLELVPHD